MSALTDELKLGLDAPICLTWELTYACNLACVHCLSSSGRRDPSELSTAEAKAVIDEMRALQVFYVNIGGGEPMIRPDFYELVDYATTNGVGVKFSTNGSRIDAEGAKRLTAMPYTDIQISIDGADAVTNDAVRGAGSFATARSAMDHLAAAEFGPFKISVVMTRQNIPQLDEFEALANSYGAELRLTRLRPAGRGADTWHELHPTQDQQVDLYHWLLERPGVLTGDSFFHLNALGEEDLPGLNLCGAGRVVCLIDPVGDVYACPFVVGVVREVDGLREPALKSRVGGNQFCHFLWVASQDDHHGVPPVLNVLHHRVNSFAAKVLFAASGQRVSLVDQQDSAVGRIEDLFDLRCGLAYKTDH